MKNTEIFAQVLVTERFESAPQFLLAYYGGCAIGDGSYLLCLTSKAHRRPLSL